MGRSVARDRFSLLFTNHHHSFVFVFFFVPAHVELLCLSSSPIVVRVLRIQTFFCIVVLKQAKCTRSTGLVGTRALNKHHGEQIHSPSLQRDIPRMTPV